MLFPLLEREKEKACSVLLRSHASRLLTCRIITVHRFLHALPPFYCICHQQCSEENMARLSRHALLTLRNLRLPQLQHGALVGTSANTLLSRSPRLEITATMYPDGYSFRAFTRNPFGEF